MNKDQIIKEIFQVFKDEGFYCDGVGSISILNPKLIKILENFENQIILNNKREYEDLDKEFELIRIEEGFYSSR